MKNSFKVSYVTTLPKEGNVPRVTITGNNKQKYSVKFYEVSDTTSELSLVKEGVCLNNQTIIASCKQWFTMWRVVVLDEESNIVFVDTFNPKGETIFIKMDAYALGDTIAWIPYVEEFRKKHGCKVICSSFHNQLLIDAYPDIIFIKPDSVIDNVYAQYYIGATDDNNPFYSPIKTKEHPLQQVASSALGLEHKELRPDLTPKYAHTEPRMKDKYVTLSEFGSMDSKHWKAEDGWQKIVDFLNKEGYKVLVISKEKTNLENVIDLTGDYNLDERAIDMMHAEFHLGVSSGLSWFAWALGTAVVMVSDVTPKNHEFQYNNFRVTANELNEVDYEAVGISSVEDVIKEILILEIILGILSIL